MIKKSNIIGKIIGVFSSDKAEKPDIPKETDLQNVIKKHNNQKVEKPKTEKK